MRSLIHGLTAPVRRRVERASDWLLQFFLVKLLVRTMHELSDDDATHMAAGIAYYALFSLFPLLLGLTALFSVFIDPESISSELTEFAGEYLPGAQSLIKENVEAALALRGALGLFAILGLFWSASAVFGAVNRSINRAWDVHVDRPLLVSKPRQLLMALGVGALFFASIGAATMAREAQRIAEAGLAGVGFLDDIAGLVVLRAASVALTLASFLLIYKFMPNTRTYWRYIWPGAIVAAVLFEVAKNTFLFYVGRFSNFENVYGSLAPVIALLLWTYVSAFILILGAELSSEYGRLRHGVERGTLLHRLM